MRQVVEQFVVDNLVKVIESYLGVDIYTNSRKRECINARMIYYKMLNERKYGWSAIAKTLNKNHATIINGVKQFDDIIMFDKELLDDYKLINEVYSATEEDVHTTSFMTRAELINEAYNLEKQNKSLNLSIEELKYSLNYYQKYKNLIQLIDDRKLSDEKMRTITTKLNHFLNGLYN
tara:strand:+ start:9296 stop:9826 length:531 start_codon:yes stop_codon:yes gene_type:complete